MSLSLVVNPLGHPDHDPVQGLAHAHLAAKPACVRQTEGQVEHVQLLVSRLLVDLCEVLLGEDDVTRGAGQGALTRPEPVNVHIIVNGDVQ